MRFLCSVLGIAGTAVLSAMSGEDSSLTGMASSLFLRCFENTRENFVCCPMFKFALMTGRTDIVSLGSGILPKASGSFIEVLLRLFLTMMPGTISSFLLESILATHGTRSVCPNSVQHNSHLTPEFSSVFKALDFSSEKVVFLS